MRRGLIVSGAVVAAVVVVAVAVTLVFVGGSTSSASRKPSAVGSAVAPTSAGPDPSPSGASASVTSPASSSALLTSAAATSAVTTSSATTPTSAPASTPSASTPSSAPTSSASAASVQPKTPLSDPALKAALAKAAKYATHRGYRTGLAVYDTKTGYVAGAGLDDGYFPTESTVKVFIAARLLISGRMHGQVEKTAYKMITQSDDDSADALYGLVGGASIEPWIAAHYHIKHLGKPPIIAGRWGNTKVTPEGMVTFYAKVKADPKVGPWLLNAMHHAHHYASDGFDQFFGIKIVDPNAAIKQGWGGDDDHFDSTVLPSTGFVGNNRFAVAIYTMHIPEIGSAAARVIVNQQARLLMPHGKIPAPS